MKRCEFCYDELDQHLADLGRGRFQFCEGKFADLKTFVGYFCDDCDNQLNDDAKRRLIKSELLHPVEDTQGD